MSRLSETRWTLEAFSTDIACLGSRGGATHGHYFMPFRLTMTAQD